MVLGALLERTARAEDAPAAGTAAAAAPGGDDEASKEGEKSAADTEGKSDKKRSLEDRVKAVQRKVFLKKKRIELYPFFATDLNDPFFQHLMVGASLAYHLADSLSLEARGGFVVASIASGAIKTVRIEDNLVLDNQPVYKYHADGDISWSPFYGKISVLGEGILHFDTYVTAGAGVWGTDTGVHPAVNFGLGQRYFLTQWLVARIELRDYLFQETRDNFSDLKKALVLGFSVSGFFPTSFEYEFQ
jgi:outer membrane beta-barrel protein